MNVEEFTNFVKEKATAESPSIEDLIKVINESKKYIEQCMKEFSSKTDNYGDRIKELSISENTKVVKNPPVKTVPTVKPKMSALEFFKENYPMYPQHYPFIEAGDRTIEELYKAYMISHPAEFKKILLEKMNGPK